MSDDVWGRAVEAAAQAWPSDSEYVNDWHPDDAALYRRDGWRSIRERREAVRRQGQERVAAAVLTAALPVLLADVPTIRAALMPLSDTLDPDEGPVILAWSVDRLAERLSAELVRSFAAEVSRG